VQVQPGADGIYQLSAWVLASTATTTFRFRFQVNGVTVAVQSVGSTLPAQIVSPPLQLNLRDEIGWQFLTDNLAVQLDTDVAAAGVMGTARGTANRG
jgi:hypothetical protein